LDAGSRPEVATNYGTTGRAVSFKIPPPICEAPFLPPRNGSALRIPAEYRSAKTFRSLKGSIKLEFGDHLPWNGLVDESKPFPGLWSAFVGGVDLGNQPLD